VRVTFGGECRLPAFLEGKIEIVDLGTHGIISACWPVNGRPVVWPQTATVSSTGRAAIDSLPRSGLEAGYISP